LQADGLVELSDGRITLTPAGRLLMRSVAMTFDAYLPVDRASARGSRMI
jgi:oxygen-independent coproporphyrinogen-3 oxidase